MVRMRQTGRIARSHYIYGGRMHSGRWPRDGSGFECTTLSTYPCQDHLQADISKSMVCKYVWGVLAEKDQRPPRSTGMVASS